MTTTFLPLTSHGIISTSAVTPTPSVATAESHLDCHNGTNMTHVKQFRDTYRTIHIYLCLVICPVGVVANIINVIVLNQRVMKSPTNFLLTVLAISDGLIMAFYIPFDIFFLMGDAMQKTHFFGAVYLLFYLNLQNILHAFSSWLIVGLALFRLLYIRLAAQSSALCNMQRARQMVVVVIGASFVLTIPYAITHVVNESTLSTVNHTYYTVDYYNDEVRQKVLFWTSAIFLKLLPLILLAILSILLVLTLKIAERRRRQLKNIRRDSNSVAQSGQRDRSSCKNSATARKANKRRRTKSTTRSLLAIVIIFMIAYLPQAILIFLIGASGSCVFREIYDGFGDFLDLLILINNGVNFILYCIMSRQFRDVFAVVFFRKKEQAMRNIQKSTQITQQRKCTAVHHSAVPVVLQARSTGLNNRDSIKTIDDDDRIPLRTQCKTNEENNHQDCGNKAVSINLEPAKVAVILANEHQFDAVNTV